MCRPFTAFLIAVALLAGCAPRGAIVVDPAARGVGSVETIYVASSRMPDPGGVDYLPDPAGGLSFSRVEVSVPPERQLGTVRFASADSPDPRRDFLTVSGQRFGNAAGFLRAVNDAVRAQPRGQREVFLFVHGFNTNFAEGLYRQAQMRHDFGTPGVSVHYAWPSAARASAYATDREIVLQARDDLEQVIDLLTRSNASRIVVAGHSMGAMLVMEALRQKALRGRAGGFSKIETVVLMAPDIDVGVFRRQASALRNEDVAVYVFSSTRDRALRLSAALRGSGARLGSLTDEAALPGLPVTIIDLSEVSGNEDSLNHFKVATSPVMISVVQGMSLYGVRVFADAARDQGLLGSGLGVVQEMTSLALTPLTER
jgi:esterase/lipase superfamily enzyme